MLTIRELAELALKTLDAQQKYFSKRQPADLEASKNLERRLRNAARDVLSPSLFDLEEKRGTTAQEERA